MLTYLARMGYRMACARHAVGALLALTVGSSTAAALDVTVRWRPSVDTTIVGYRVYARPRASTYPAGIDVALPSRATDGSMSAIVRGLPSSTNFYAVAGYNAAGKETGLSNEIGPMDSCTLDACWTPSGCTFDILPDGTTCPGVSSDPCTGFCSAGICGAARVLPLATRRIRLNRSTRGARLAAQATLPAVVAAPGATGATIIIREAAGATMFVATIPPGGFAETPGGRVYSFRPSRRERATTEIRRVTLGRLADGWRLRLRADLQVIGDAPQVPLRWAVLLGGECASDTATACIADERKVVCEPS